MLVPPNWDSWGKIRVLRDGFDVEAVNKGWSVDIEESYDLAAQNGTNGVNGHVTPDEDTPPVPGAAVEAYQETIRDPSLDALQATASEGNGLKLEVSSQDAQKFLATQVEVLDKIRQGAEPSSMDSSRVVRGRQSSQSRVEQGDDEQYDEGRVNEHIGPVQFNMGGIQVDADDMLRRLRVGFRDIPFLRCSSTNVPHRTGRPTRHQSQHHQAMWLLLTERTRMKPSHHSSQGS